MSYYYYFLVGTIDKQTGATVVTLRFEVNYDQEPSIGYNLATDDTAAPLEVHGIALNSAQAARANFTYREKFAVVIPEDVLRSRAGANSDYSVRIGATKSAESFVVSVTPAQVYEYMNNISRYKSAHGLT